jgi:hypothetical protein
MAGRKGIPLTDEHRRKISEATRGPRPHFIPWNKGTKGICKPSSTSFKKGQPAWNYKGRWKGSNGYIMVKAPQHPFSSKRDGNIFEHRLVMEQHLGRYLKPSEQVHHINHVQGDNRIENLKLCSSNAEHKRAHVQQFPDGKKICTVCKQIKPLNEFPFRKSPPGIALPRRYYGSWCYPCCRMKKYKSSILTSA